MSDRKGKQPDNQTGTRDKSGRFVKGGPSPNPAGRPKKVREIEDEILRDFGDRVPDILNRLIDCVMGRVRLSIPQIQAANAVMDRVIGKARQRTEVTGPPGPNGDPGPVPVALDFSRMTTEKLTSELEAFKARIQARQGRTPEAAEVPEAAAPKAEG